MTRNISISEWVDRLIVKVDNISGELQEISRRVEEMQEEYEEAQENNKDMFDRITSLEAELDEALNTD